MSDEDIKIGNKILKGSDLTHTIKLSNYGADAVWVAKIPNNIDQEAIERDIAIRLGGSNLESFPVAGYNIIRRNVTLQHVLTDSPSWFDINNSYDEDLMELVWNKYLDFRENFRKSLKKKT